jgi:hypothetical protein
MSEQFVRHRQPWTAEEVGTLRTLATKGMGLKAIAILSAFARSLVDSSLR